MCFWPKMSWPRKMTEPLCLCVAVWKCCMSLFTGVNSPLAEPILQYPGRVLTTLENLENLENSGNFLIPKNSGKTQGILSLLGEFL